ncbi:MAG: hypothetical protein MJ252_20030, partial [archaeon]|nr:hypothetical protein [archaeon]
MNVRNFFNLFLVHVKEESEESKTISTIPFTALSEEEQEMINKEKKLKKELFDLQGKHKNIAITYSNVLGNINELLAEEGYVPPENGEEEKKEEKEGEVNETTKGDVNETTKAGGEPEDYELGDAKPVTAEEIKEGGEPEDFEVGDKPREMAPAEGEEPKQREMAPAEGEEPKQREMAP